MMNEKNLKNAVKQVKLPEDSKKRIIQKLELISQEENVFQAEPVRLPIFRYLLTGVATCALVAMSAGGLFHLASMRTQNNNSQFSPSGSIVLDNAISDFSNQEAYFITKESGTQYFNLSKSETQDYLENLQVFLTNHVDDLQTDYLASYTDYFILYLKNRNYFEFFNDGNYAYIVIKNLEEQNYCLEITIEDYENFKAMLANPESYFDLPYENADTILTGNVEEDIMNTMFSETPFGDISEMQARIVLEDFSQKSENSEKSGKYYIIPTEEQYQKFADFLNQVTWKKSKKNIEEIAKLENNWLEVIMYFISPSGEKFTVHMSNYVIVTSNDNQTVYEIDNLSYLETIYDMFASSNLKHKLTSGMDIFEEMSSEKITPFGDVSQLQERITVSEYPEKYIIPTEEQHQKFAYLLNNSEWNEITDIDENFINELHSQNPIFTIYFNTNFILDVYDDILCYYDPMKSSLPQCYEMNYLVSELYHIFTPADNTLYDINPDIAIFEQMFVQELTEYNSNSTEKITPFGDVSQMQERVTVSEYPGKYIIPTEEQHQKFASLLNQAEWKDTADIDENFMDSLNPSDLNLAIYFDTGFRISFYGDVAFLFLDTKINESNSPEYYSEKLFSEIYDIFVPADTLYDINPDIDIFEQISNQDCIVKIPDIPILIHDESFSRNSAGEYELEADIAYVISQEKKRQLSDFIATQELQAFAGYPEFQRENNYQKFVVELIEEDAFFTVEYDIEQNQYYFILCSQMEIPGEPVETGSYCYFPVSEEFYQTWNALLANSET